MDQQNTGLKAYYTEQIRSYMKKSLELKDIIENSKTTTKKKFYTKKLVRNNKKCAHVVEKLGKYMERLENAE